MKTKNKTRKKLEKLVKEDRLYCEKYREHINLEMLYRKKCYFQTQSREYCKYITIK